MVKIERPQKKFDGKRFSAFCTRLGFSFPDALIFWDHETMDTEENEPCTLSLQDLILLADSFEALIEKIKASLY